MIRPIDPNKALMTIYKHKVRRSEEVQSAIFLRIAMRVLRYKFGFSPEMTKEFMEHFEAERSKEEKSC